MYLKSVKGAPFQQSPHVKAITGSTAPRVLFAEKRLESAEFDSSIRSAIILTKKNTFNEEKRLFHGLIIMFFKHFLIGE